MRAYVGKNASDLLLAILNGKAVLASTLNPQVSPEVDQILKRALDKSADARYQSMAELHEAVKQARRTHSGVQAVAQPPKPGPELPHSAPAAPSPASLSLPLTAGLSQTIDQAPMPTHPGVARANPARETPQVRYALSGEVNIAYQVIGAGELDLVFVMGWISHLEYFWSEPSFARFLRRLASFARVILFDKRGTGLSDRVPLDQLPTLEQRMDDVRAVMQAAGSRSAVLCGVSEGGPMCSLFAATYPEKTTALVMLGSYARRLRGDGYPWGPTSAQLETFLEEIRRNWGGPVGLETRAASVANDPDFRSWWASYLRHGASPSAAVALTKMNSEIDIRHVLPGVRVPTLVLHRSGDACFHIDEGRFLANHIPGAKFVELPGVDHLPFVGNQDEFLDEIEEFLTGVRHASAVDRVLATVLIVRIAHVTTDVEKLADTLQLHQSHFEKKVAMFKGKSCAQSGEFLMATFDGPARAIRAARDIRASAMRFNIALGLGLHTGECDLIGSGVGGDSVEIASQLAQLAQADEVLVSSTLKDLVAGSGIEFSPRGVESLGARLGSWQLYSV
jgi:pimeloyl-ACP methyl ester carboxylesterase/class 3 adenylate cyclase